MRETNNGTIQPVSPVSIIDDPLAGKERATFSEVYANAFTSWIGNVHKAGAERAFAKLPTRHQNALREGTAGDGGYLAPAQVRAEILSRAGALSAVRGGATTIPTTKDRLDVPAFVPGGSSTAVSDWTASWVGETSTLATDDPSLETYSIDIFKLRLPPLVMSNDLMEDAPFALTYIEQLAARTLAIAEDVAFISGSGVNQPRGILNSGATSASGGGPSVAGLQGVFQTLAGQYRQNASWVMSEVVETDARQLEYSNGGAVYPRDSANGGIEGRPVSVTSAIGDSNVIVGDMAGYLIAERSLSIDIDKWNYIGTDSTAIWVRHRLGGGVWDTDAFSLGSIS